jgi:hypothetical protein
MDYNSCDETPICKKLYKTDSTAAEDGNQLIIFINIIAMFFSRTIKLFKVTLDGELQEYKYRGVERKKLNITSEEIQKKFDLAMYVA